jgi:hypothetical protein
MFTEKQRKAVVLFIKRCLGKGWVHREIADELNRRGPPPQVAKRWTAGVVQAMVTGDQRRRELARSYGR